MRCGGTLVLLALAATPLAAQSYLSLGVELGYARADFIGKDAAGVSVREGAVAGAYFRVPLASWLAVQQGLLIASKGGATTVNDSAAAPLRFELDLVYLEMPLVFRARIPALVGTRLVLLGGVSPSYRVGCNVEFSRNGFSLTRTACDQATTASFRSWDFSLIGGVGIGIPIERSELALEARLSRGIRSVSDLGDIRNRALDLVVSIPF
jgi:Outer membrane protein beta-barrel domain